MERIELVWGGGNEKEFCGWWKEERGQCGGNVLARSYSNVAMHR